MFDYTVQFVYSHLYGLKKKRMLGWRLIPVMASYSMFPESTQETFSQKMYLRFKNDKRFIKPKLSRTIFTISHHAGEEKQFFFIFSFAQFC